MASTQVVRMLGQEARALNARLDRVHGFGTYIPMVEAAQPMRAARTAIDAFIESNRRRLNANIDRFLVWLDNAGRKQTPDAAAQRRFSALKMRFTWLTTQFDLFADVWTQRSEHDTGVWLAGLDRVAEDALRLPGSPYPLPPLICYLDRGPGAAIRRARTRLPGGGSNPVAVIRVPRERLIGSGIASSVVHEVGHQGTALMDLVQPLRRELLARVGTDGHGAAWSLWGRWISEIIADVWSVAHLGITSTVGLIGVVSLPRAFVFRITEDDPHPPPWIRVRLSAAIGAALFPDPQWHRISRTWEALYPPRWSESDASLIAALDATRPELIERILSFRPAVLGGRPLMSAFPVADRQPDNIRAHFNRLERPESLMRLPPTLAMAVIGQAREQNRLNAEREAELIEGLLKNLAVSAVPAHRNAPSKSIPAPSH